MEIVEQGEQVDPGPRLNFRIGHTIRVLNRKSILKHWKNVLNRLDSNFIPMNSKKLEFWNLDCVGKKRLWIGTTVVCLKSFHFPLVHIICESAFFTIQFVSNCHMTFLLCIQMYVFFFFFWFIHFEILGKRQRKRGSNKHV